ncbi:MAG: hypothetical protein IKL27_06435 [Oscillospiraceae bacterium]|nr:hypothetical protein [Oscillospiraceae bacterium]
MAATDKFHSRTTTTGTGTVAAPNASPLSAAETAQKNAQEMGAALRAAYAERVPSLQETTTNSGTVNVTNTGGFPADPTIGDPAAGDGSYRASSGGSNAYKAATLRAATSQADYINAMYDANEQRRKAALETAYDANVATLDRQSATIAPQYQQAANAAAAQSAVAQAAFNERAAAAGMNTGAGSQAALAQNNALVSSISAIRQAESEALADVEAKRADLAAQYQKAIADAIAANEADRALALYNEAIRVDESMVTTAANQATENFRAWQAKYG